MDEIYEGLDRIANSLQRGMITFVEAEKLMTEKIEDVYRKACMKNWENPGINYRRACRKKYRLLLELTKGE